MKIAVVLLYIVGNGSGNHKNSPLTFAIATSVVLIVAGAAVWTYVAWRKSRK